MKTIESIKTYAASAENVFDCLDDLSITGMHMSQSSMPMMGGKMNIEFLTPYKTGLPTKYRWTGYVLWMTLFVWGEFVLLAVFWLFVQCIQKLPGQHISRSKDGYIDPHAKRT